MKRTRVCVIGAGAAGLAAARHLTACQLNVFDVSVFEQASCIGGTWVYNENTGSDESGLPIHSSMYKNLRTNLPKEVMAFPDFPFPSEWSSYITRQQVLSYLEDYAAKFNLSKYIYFNSVVRKVRPLDREGSRDPEWQVIVENTLTNEYRTLQFEAVVVCNGHFSVPHEPVILGMDSFPGLVVHSHCYRSPDTFQGKRLVILGASFSGKDICLEVAECADMVYLSHKKFISSKLPDNVEQHRPISSVSGDGTVQFHDGQQRKADAILLCTGYRFSFPFLDHKCGIQVANNRVTHLYKHIFDIKYPTLSFVGIPLRVCGIFTLINLQAQFITAVLSKQRHLPSEDEMRADEESEFQERLCFGLHEKYAHDLAEGQFDYNNTIAQLVGTDRPGSFHKSICKHAVNRHSQSLMSYKSDEYKLTSDGTWTFKEFHM